MPGQLEGRIAIITGAGRGIGRAIALRFAAEGAKLVLAARTKSQLESVAHEIGRTDGTAVVAADLSEESGSRQAVRAAKDKFGALHIVVNNAGIYGPVKPVEEITQQEWDEVLAVNLRGAFLVTRAALPHLYAAGTSAIVNVSSVAAKAAIPWGAAYAASKAALLSLTRTTAAEGARKGLRCNAILPGPVPETEMSQELGRKLAESAGRDAGEMFKEFLGGILQGRPQTADEIAAAALYLASDQSSAITGQALNVDGGMLFC
ncbi:MAG TPA: SDR family NAD(P)-dependent oxidoreductase [Candidatus Acidoferrales bacterium]|nr:SDR family NAD(P)-dependent oxidoreductase [Candidatus Acidoferrales bacterium]